MAKVKEAILPVTANVPVNVEGTSTNFDDVGDFHDKFDLPRSGEDLPAQLLILEVHEFRFGFLREELYEYRDAWEEGDLAKAADSLIDLVYVAMGTAHMMGLPWQELWDEVQRANMAKERAPSAEASAASSGRGSALDVIKPEGWQPPDIEGVLQRHG